jgi:hypothetical protein
MDGVTQDAVAKAGLECLTIHHVTGPREDLVDVDLHARVFENPERAIRIEFHENVDIAGSGSLCPRDRTDYRRMADASRRRNSLW